MSILIRTGSGKTDLSYTDNAVKDLKVLQKTGTKSVQWITTQAGTTYNNILQKRGVRDLFYGDITIPSDLPQWQANPYSGTTPKWYDTSVQPQWTEIIWKTSSSTTSLIRTKKLNVADNNWQYGVVLGTDILTTFNPSKNDTLNVYLKADSGWNFTASTVPDIQIAKIFFIDNTNENNKLVMKVNFIKHLWSNADDSSGSAGDSEPAEYKIECGIEEIYSNNLTLAYSTTKNYKVGIRTTLE